MNALAHRMSRGLGWGLCAGVALPWLVGEWVNTMLQPGIADGAAAANQLVDFVVIGSIVFSLSLWVVAAFACWIVQVMKGPQRRGDAFPADQPGNAP